MKFGLKLLKKRELKLQELKGLQCLNCDKPLVLSDNFCSKCGQKNRIKLLNFGDFIHNLFSGFLNYDSRFWKTIVPLLIKPGKVSKDYVFGKRARFVNPFQMYLNVSIIFFLILGVSNKFEESLKPPKNIIAATGNFDTIPKQGNKQLDSIKNKVHFPEMELMTMDEFIPLAKKNEQVESVMNVLEKKSIPTKKNFNLELASDSSKTEDLINKLERFQKYNKKYPDLNADQALDSLKFEKSLWNKFYYQQIININKNYSQLKSDGGKSYVKKLTSYISISLFVFLPFFTLFLKLLYLRRKFSYMEHLVFVFHTQTVFFLLIIIFYLIDAMVDLSNVFWVFIILFLLYLYKALRNFYEQRRFKTIVKFLMLNSFYMFLASIGFSIVAILSFIMD
jgi:hypothetical protein